MRRNLFLILIFISCQLNAGTLKKDQPFCATKELLSNLITLVSQNDVRGVEHLLNNGCLIAPRDMEISILKKKLISLSAKIIVYNGDDSIEAWAPLEGIVDAHNQ